MLLEFELCHLEIVEQSERLALCLAGCTRGIHLGFMVDVRPSLDFICSWSLPSRLKEPIFDCF